MKRWVVFAVGGMLSIAAAGCAHEPAATAGPSLAPKPKPVAPVTRPATRPTTRPSTRPVARVRPATRPIVRAKPATQPTSAPVLAAEFWDGHGKCEGIASFYAGKFIGRRTANGERYTGRKLTAAHRVLPFGTYVKVTRLDNGLSVIVRINDRGPYVDGRVIDLSPAAARRLHMINNGVTQVKLEVVAPWMAEE
jgi:rare lipoprotein A (peptidoglycan hydrolase)